MGIHIMGYEYVVILVPNLVLVTGTNSKGNKKMNYTESKNAVHAKPYDSKDILGI